MTSIPIASAAAAVAILAAVPIVYAFATRGSGGPTLTKVDANSVGIIDPKRNALVGQVRVGNEPDRVSVGDGAVWVANTTDRTAMKIDPARPAIVHTYITGLDRVWTLLAGPAALWEGGGANHRSSVTRIDGRYGTVTGPTPFLSVRQSQAANFGLALTNRTLWVAVQGTLAQLDPGSLRLRAARNDLSIHATDMVAGAGSLWILNGTGGIGLAEGATQGSVTRFDPGSASVTVTIPVGNDSVAIAYGEGSVWVGLLSGTVVRIDPTQNAVVGTFSSNAGLSDLAVGEGSVWAANTSSPTVTRIDPQSLKAVATIELGTRPAGIAVGFGKVWVTAY